MGLGNHRDGAAGPADPLLGRNRKPENPKAHPGQWAWQGVLERVGMPAFERARMLHRLWRQVISGHRCWARRMWLSGQVDMAHRTLWAYWESVVWGTRVDPVPPPVVPLPWAQHRREGTKPVPPVTGPPEGFCLWPHECPSLRDLAAISESCTGLPALASLICISVPRDGRCPWAPQAP